MSVGEKIRTHRKIAALTQTELAELLGVSVQAVSKWETGAGMPDIGQIVPLAKILNVSTDRLLENDDSDEFASIRRQIRVRSDFWSGEEAEKAYELVEPFFLKDPGNTEAALYCLQSITGILAENHEPANEKMKQEAERCISSVMRGETDADRLCRAYYLSARFYNLMGEKSKADAMIEKLPFVFGDRKYWAAETALAEGDRESAAQKCRESLIMKGQFLLKGIAMIGRIREEEAGDTVENVHTETLLLQKAVLDALLSQGDVWPLSNRRLQISCQLMREAMAAGKSTEAAEALKDLLDNADRFLNRRADGWLFSPADEESKPWQNQTRAVKKLVGEVLAETAELRKSEPAFAMLAVRAEELLK